MDGAPSSMHGRPAMEVRVPRRSHHIPRRGAAPGTALLIVVLVVLGSKLSLGSDSGSTCQLAPYIKVAIQNDTEITLSCNQSYLLAMGTTTHTRSSNTSSQPTKLWKSLSKKVYETCFGRQCCTLSANKLNLTSRTGNISIEGAKCVVEKLFHHCANNRSSNIGEITSGYLLSSGYPCIVSTCNITFKKLQNIFVHDIINGYVNISENGMFTNYTVNSNISRSTNVTQILIQSSIFALRINSINSSENVMMCYGSHQSVMKGNGTHQSVIKCNGSHQSVMKCNGSHQSVIKCNGNTSANLIGGIVGGGLVLLIIIIVPIIVISIRKRRCLCVRKKPDHSSASSVVDTVQSRGNLYQEPEGILRPPHADQKAHRKQCQNPRLFSPPSFVPPDPPSGPHYVPVELVLSAKKGGKHQYEEIHPGAESNCDPNLAEHGVVIVENSLYARAPHEQHRANSCGITLIENELYQSANGVC